MKTIMGTPVFVTGVERSGSTIIAKIIASCGAYSGEVTPRMENIKIKKLLDHYYLFEDSDPRGQYPLPNIHTLTIHDNWYDQVGMLLGDKIDSKPWVYKSTRIAQTWKLWAQAFPDAKWIIVRRKPGDVIHSCLKTGYMKAFKHEWERNKVGVHTEAEGWNWWIHEQEKRFMEMVGAQLDLKLVWPERMVKGDFDQVFEMLEWLQLPYDQNKVRNLVKPMLWNSKTM